MTEKELLRAIGGIDDELIEEAAPAEPAKRKQPVILFLRRNAKVLVPLAAAVAVGLFFGIRYLGRTGPDVQQAPPVLGTDSQTPGGTNDLLTEQPLLEYQGCYYSVTDDAQVLQRYGLPGELTEDLAGEHVCYLASAGEADYEVAEEETGAELLRYAPSDCDAVYLVRNGDRYAAAIFGNVIHYGDTNETTEFGELYRIYGIGSAEDIAGIVPVDWNRDEETGTPVTDREEIAEFYRLTAETPAVGNDDFQSSVFGGIDEAQQSEAHTKFADDTRVLRIETKDGLRFYIDVYPSYGWMYAGGTLSYFGIDDGTENWLQKNITG